MSGKNFGPAVSGYLDPTGRNWETTVFQAGKPVLDKELNLQQDIDGGQAEADLRREMPSGWISDDFVATSDPVLGFFVPNATSLTLQMVQGLVAHVNGWLLRIQHTGTINTNTMTLTAGPVGNGASRTDLVVLEVWRMLLSSVPSPVGKSASGRIWQQGNVKTDPGNDLVLNFPDDIQDTNLGSESTKRVQIQYRLRVIPGVDLFAHPYGMEDPAVVARSVPPNAATPDGAATVFAYTNQSANGDPGLWLAGDGNPANTLGTVDGLMYAIPLMGIFRRNTGGFDRVLNQNGGLATPLSNRPDGLFSDVFDRRDLVDLRLGVSPTGWDMAEVLTKNLNYLLDNNLHSEWMTNTFGGGAINGATVLWADEIGPFPSDGAGPLIGNFDAGRRRFSGRSIYETITVEIPAPGGGWTTGSTVTIDPTALPIYPYAAFNWSSYAPAQVCITDIDDAWWLGATGKKTVDAMQFVQSVTNLGAIPTATLTVTFGTLTGIGLTNESLFVDIVVAYPTGVGLTKTPVNTFGVSSFALTGGSMPAGVPVTFNAFANQLFDPTHREVQLEYTTGVLTVVQAANTDSGTTASVSSIVGTTATITGLSGMNPGLVGQQLTITGAATVGNNGTFPIIGYVSTTSVQVTNAGAVAPDANNGAISWTIKTGFFRMPERVNTIVTVLKNGIAIVGGTVIDSTGRIISFTNGADFTVTGDTLTISYTGLRPMPQNNEQMTIYYDAAAPQAARQAILTGTLQVIPKLVSGDLYVLTPGSGSQDEGYPWPQGYVQVGGIWPNSTNTYSGEADLSARADVAVTDFNATTGFLKLPVFLPMVANPEQLSFTGLATDVEGRSFYNAVPGGTYVPNAYAQGLSSAIRHKDFLPILCELAADTPLGHRGQLVLALLIRYALFDENNAVAFNSDQTVNTTVASVFRLKGNLLNKRAV